MVLKGEVERQKTAQSRKSKNRRRILPPMPGKNVKVSGKKDLFYAIQVASSKTQIKDLRYLKLKDKVEELKGGGRYRYYVKITPSYEKALEFQKEVRKTVKWIVSLLLFIKGNR